MLTTIIHPTNRALTTLSAVKSRLGITESAEDSTLLDMIAEASSDIVGFCRRDLARRKVHELLAGSGLHELLLSGAPLDPSGISVMIDGATAADWIVSGDDPGLLYRDDAWPWSVASNPGVGGGYIAGTEKPNIAVRYWCGYTLPGDGLRDPAGGPVTSLVVSEAAGEGATSISLATPEGTTGTLAAGSGITCGLDFFGRGCTVEIATDAEVVDDALEVELAEGLPAALAAGEVVTSTLVYLPEAISAEAIRLVQAKRFERQKPTGASSVSAQGVAISWETQEQVCEGMVRRIGRWRRTW